MLRKLTGYLPRPSIISSQFYKSAKRKGQRSESRSAEIDRSCHLYEERERDGISFPGAWNDRHGAIRGAERIVSIGRQKSIISSPSRCDRKRRRRRATSDYSRPPRLAEESGDRLEKNVLLGRVSPEIREREN